VCIKRTRVKPFDQVTEAGVVDSNLTSGSINGGRSRPNIPATPPGGGMY
jgi:hypothetical protein